ncbi:ATP-binding protein [Mariprofundus erugo]|uniref:ATP-binding protein n=1 Tax=Mariprofundus erugo TaxID=2528639 RepID=UPI0010FDA143|nr:ATP-binding protein [Mariprofundus erugo]TLS77579.1 ATP-binding protein [Mariprofundus erugo]
MTANPWIQDVAFPDCENSHVGKICLQMNCNSDCVHILRSIVAVMTARTGMSELQSNRVAIAVDELFANIASHAYDGKPGKVEFECRIDESSDGGGELIIDLRDYASCNWSGCLEEAASRTIDHENPCPGGLGLKLICAVVDECEHTRLPDGNHWRLIFKFNGRTNT